MSFMYEVPKNFDFSHFFFTYIVRFHFVPNGLLRNGIPKLYNIEDWMNVYCLFKEMIVYFTFRYHLLQYYCIGSVKGKYTDKNPITKMMAVISFDPSVPCINK